MTLFRAVFTVLAVLALAYWCSRLLAKQYIKTSGSSSLQVIEQLQVGQNQRILLINVGESNYLIGVSQAGIQFLAEVKGDFGTEALQPVQEKPVQFPFRDIMDRYLAGHQKKEEEDK